MRTDPALQDFGYTGWSAFDIVKDAVRRFPEQRIALVSSFGAESAVLLHMVSLIDATLPVIFLDTEKLFHETYVYRDEMIRRLGVANVRIVMPKTVQVESDDIDGQLYRRSADRCCLIRKVLPLRDALEGLSAWINGRKGHHGGLRSGMPAVERDGPRWKITPLHDWSAADVNNYYQQHELPRHPLFHKGYTSIGCRVCSAPTFDSGNVRAGRWPGIAKTECGIHTCLSANPKACG